MGRGGSGVDKRPNGQYRARVTFKGRQITLGTFPKKTEAKDAVDRARTEIRARRFIDPTLLGINTLGEFASEWIASADLAPKTVEAYKTYWRLGLKVFADRKPDDVTPKSVSTWFTQRSKKTPTMAEREATHLNKIFVELVDMRAIEENPVRLKTLIKKNKKRKAEAKRATRVPTDYEVITYLNVFAERAPRLRLWVLLAAYGGLRLSEARALRRQDLIKDSDGRYWVNVTRQAIYTSENGWEVTPPKSAEGIRQIPLPLEVTPDIDEHLATHVGRFPVDLLFPSRGTGTFVSDKTFYRAWDHARFTAGSSYRVKPNGERVPYVVHKGGRKRGGAGNQNTDKKYAIVHEVSEHYLRHYAGTRLAESHGDKLMIKKFMGHESLKTTEGYLHSRRHATAILDAMPSLKGGANNIVPISEARNQKEA